MPDNLSNPTPQFGTAEYAGVAGTERCQFCHQPIAKGYYRVNGAMACSACGERAKHQLPEDSHGRFTRALLFGIGGAILGLIIYAVFTITTGLIIGYVSLAVGYIVGKAIKMGSRGAGGRRYQIAAVALTYAAVSLAAVPISLSYSAKARSAQREQVAQQQSPGDNEQPPQQTEAPRAERMGLGTALLQLAFIGLASPFMELAGDPFHGLIGLVILSVGIRIAWKLAAGSEMEIFGPFENTAAASSGAGA